jgi:hypothetical protein
MRAVPRAVALIAAALALAACGDDPSPGPGDGPAIVAVGPVCLAGEPLEQTSLEPGALARPRIEDVDPAAFVRCRQEVRRVPGQGEWSVRVEERADAGLEALAAALRLPDERRGDVCPAIAHGVPELWALDRSGRTALVRWPLDVCAAPRAEAVRAYDALRWSAAGSRRVTQITTQAVLDSGCSDSWKQVVAIEAADGRPRDGGRLGELRRAAGVRVCVYRIDDRSETPSGTFQSGRRIEGKDWQVLLGALEAAPRAAPGCEALGQLFAVLTAAAGTGDPLYVELDSCRRVLLPDGGLRVATPRVLQQLAPA